MNVQGALGRLAVGISVGRERGVVVEQPVASEFAVFESCGDLGMVERLDNGGVLLTVDQLRIFRERDGMNAVSVERQRDGRYLLNVRK